MHLKGTIVSLKKLIDKHRYLYSIVFFFLISVLYGWYSNLKIGNLASEKTKPDMIFKSSKNTKENSKFFSPDLKGDRRHFVDPAFAGVQSLRPSLVFCTKSHWRGIWSWNILMCQSVGRGISAFPTWMCFDFMSICLFSLLPGTSEAEPASAEDPDWNEK